MRTSARRSGSGSIVDPDNVISQWKNALKVKIVGFPVPVDCPEHATAIAGVVAIGRSSNLSLDARIVEGDSPDAKEIA